MVSGGGLNLSCVCSGWSLDDCLACCVLPLGSIDNVVRWYDDASTKGLVAALGTAITIFDISDNKKAPLVLTYPEAAPEVSLSLIKYGCHFDMVY